MTSSLVARVIFWEQQRAENKEEQKRREHAARIAQETLDEAQAKEEDERRRQEHAAQIIREDDEKQASLQHAGSYHALPKVSLVVIANLRGIDFSGSKTILLQMRIESDNAIRGNNSTTLNSGQTTENSLQEAQQAGPSDFLTENECPILAGQPPPPLVALRCAVFSGESSRHPPRESTHPMGFPNPTVLHRLLVIAEDLLSIWVITTQPPCRHAGPLDSLIRCRKTGTQQ